MKLLCRIFGHKVYYQNGTQLGYRTYGPGYRYCGRCLSLLSGTTPKVGDRYKIVRK